MTDLPRNQHIVASGLVAVVGIWVTYISYTAEPAEAFLFPACIIATDLCRAGALDLRQGDAGEIQAWATAFRATQSRTSCPGFSSQLIYAFWAAETLGFYTASTLAFFILLSLYDPAAHGELQDMDQTRYHHGGLSRRHVRSLRDAAECLHTARDFLLNRNCGRAHPREDYP